MKPFAIRPDEWQAHISRHQVHEVHRFLQLGTHQALAHEVMDGGVLATVVEAVLTDSMGHNGTFIRAALLRSVDRIWFEFKLRDCPNVIALMVSKLCGT